MRSDAANDKGQDSAEQVSVREALERMKKFIERKDRFVNAVKADKNRRLSPRKKE